MTLRFHEIAVNSQRPLNPRDFRENLLLGNDWDDGYEKGKSYLA